MEKRHFNRNRRLAAAVAAMAFAGLGYSANATLTFDLAVDPSATPPGTKTANAVLNTPITLDVWATVTGGNTNPEGFQSADLNFRSTGNIQGTFAPVNQTGWTAAGFQTGTQQDLDDGGSGDLDLGSTIMSDPAGWWIVRSGSVVTNASGQFLLGKVQFTPTALNAGTATNLQVSLRNQTNGALWFEDATSSPGTGAGSPPPTIWSGDKNPTTGGTAIGAAVVISAVVGPITSEWTNPAGGNWTVSGNWSGGVPSATGDVAQFLATGSSGGHTTVSLNANETVGGMVFGGTNGYSIAPAAAQTLTLNATGTPTININSATHDISAKVILAKDTSIAGSGGQLTLSNLDNSAGKTITKSSASTLVLSGTQVHGTNAALAVTGGTVNLNADTGKNVNFAVGDGFPDTGDEIPATANLAVSLTSGVININANQNLKSLTMAPNRSPSNGGTGTGATRIQIGNNVKVHVYGNGTNDDIDPSRATAENLWRGAQAGFYDDAGFNGGDGSGTIGGGEFGNGIFLNGVSNTSINGLGMAMVDDGNNFQNTIEMREMMLGDLNGDNSVDPADGGIFGTYFGNSPASFGYTLYTWMEGDLNGDGAVDPADGGIFASNFPGTFNAGNGPLPGGVSAVPEPASLGLLAVGAVSLLRRRRKV